MAGQVGSQGLDTLRTAAERTDFVETTRYAEVVAFMEAVADRVPWVHTVTMGYSGEGRAIPMWVVGRVDDPSPEGVRASGKLRVHLQGTIHGGEVPGKEALLMLVRDMATGRTDGARWLDQAVLLVVPVYNVDGNERVALTNRPRQHGPIGGMGQRPNAAGLDLNRDHMKLDSPEARSFARMLSAYDPHLGVDLHTTNGTRHAYHLTYAPPLHPGTPEAVASLLRDRGLPRIRRQMADAGGWRTHDYGNTRMGPDGEVGWYTFDHRPRFNNNYLGLRNRAAILSEAYAYSPFAERVASTRAFVEAILDWASADADAVRTAVRASEASVVGATLPLRATFQGSDEPVEILMGEVAEERHPYTGATLLRRLETVRPTPMREYVGFRGVEWERVPARYLILPEADQVVDRLLAHGVQLGRIDEAGRRTVEAFRVDSIGTAAREFQGHRERTPFGAWESASREIPAGTWVVEMDQPLGRLAYYLLEPRSDDGLAAWGLVEMEEGPEGFPVLRILRPLPAPAPQPGRPGPDGGP